MLRRFLQKIGAATPDPPAGCVTRLAQELVEGPWNGYRLVRASDSQPGLVGGEWPLILGVRFLESGEGGQPTVYVCAADDPGGDFCLAPIDEVVMIPAPLG